METKNKIKNAKYQKKAEKIVYWGTSEFSAIILKKLIANNYSPVLIITAPDKPKGRGYLLTAPIIKNIANQCQIPCLQPEKLKENQELKNKIVSLLPDLFIVAAYGLIIPKNLLDIPIKNAINVHPSLLPKYRGPSPIQTAILNNEQLTGVSLILITEQMDAGPIIKTQSVKIENQNYKELSKELAETGADLLIQILPDWLEGKIRPILQDESMATYTKMIRKENGLINFEKTAEKIEKQIRAFHFWPGAYLKISIKGKTKILKILEAEALPALFQNKKIGSFFEKEKKPIIVCGENNLLLKKVQLEGKSAMSGKDFLNGYRRWLIE